MATQIATQPVTAPQIDLIDRLAVEREWAALPAEFVAIVGKVVAGTEDDRKAALAGLDRRRASRIIDALFDCRYARATSRAAEPGYYVQDGTVFVVVANRAGTSTYAKRLTITSGRGHWQYAAGASRVLAAAGMVPLTVAEAARLGKLHGVCVVCGRALVDPASVNAGIGPVCSRRLTHIPAAQASQAAAAVPQQVDDDNRAEAELAAAEAECDRHRTGGNAA